MTSSWGWGWDDLRWADSIRKPWKEHVAFSLERLGWGGGQNMAIEKVTKPVMPGRPRAPDPSLGTGH